MRAVTWGSEQLRSLTFVVPVVLKELRQEIRMKAFDLFFVVPQIVGGLFLLFSATTSVVSRDVGEGIRALFLMLLLIPLFVYLPLRACVSVSKDTNSGALELVSLSRISNWHLVAGKLFSLSIFALLFVTAVAPYGILQYYTMRADVLSTIAELYLAFLGSLIVSAMTLAAAPMKQRGAVAIIWLLGGVVFVPMVITAVTKTTRITSAISLIPSVTDAVVVTVVAALLILLLIEVASERLATPLDDFGPRKRLLTLIGIVVFGYLLAFHVDQREVVFAGFLLFSAPLAVISLFEDSSAMMASRIVQQGGGWRWFVRRGWLAGLTTTMVFSSLVLLGWQISVLSTSANFTFIRGIIQHAQLFCGLLGPWILVQSLPIESSRKQFLYYLIQVLSFFILVSRHFIMGAALMQTVGQFTVAGVFYRIGRMYSIDSDLYQIGFSVIILAPGCLILSLLLLKRHIETVRIAKKLQ